ncbi:MAG: NAD(P)-dependent oxidoreductase [Candidatus Omnitrophota bacterium]
MKALVISGSGWLGHNVVKKLVKRGHNVTVIAIDQKEKFKLPPPAKFIWGDRTKTPEFKKILAGVDAESVVDVTPDTESTKNIIESFKGRIKHYVHCSSTGVYTPLQRIPANEEHPWEEPTGLNFMFKVEPDRLALEYYRRDGFPATIIRPTNIMGPGSLPIDIWGARNPRFLWRVLKEETITVPNDGRALLQPVYVEDLAEAFALVLENKQSIGQTYNIAGDYSVTLNEYLRLICEILKRKPPVTHLPIGEMINQFAGKSGLDVEGLKFFCEHMCFDISKAKKELGYRVNVSLEESVKRTIDWCLANNLISSTQPTN